MDSLEIKALSVNTRIGVHIWEQRISQRLLLDIGIPMDFTACTDDINSTLDYDKLCQNVTQYIEINTFQLIETVANAVAELIKKEFKVPKVTVSVSKPHAIKNAGDIRVTVAR